MAISTKTEKILIFLLVATFFNGLSWAGIVPMWHAPDEQAHFAQVQNVVVGKKNEAFTATTSEDIAKSEELLGTFRTGGNNSFTYHPEYRIGYSDSTKGVHEEEIISFPLSDRGEFVITEATGYPPLYYWYSSMFNRIFWRNDLIFRVFITRIATVIITVAAVWVSFLLAREIFVKEKYALAAAGLVSFQPMWSFVGGGVTSDALMNLVYPLGLLMLVRWRRYPGKLSGLVIFLSTVATALLTKVQSVALLVIGLPLMLIMARGGKKIPGVMVWVSRLILAVIFLVGAVALRRSFPGAPAIPLPNGIVVPEISSLNIGGRQPSIGGYLTMMGGELYRQGFPWYWGVYRWLSLTLPIWVYRVIKIVILFSAAGWIKSFFGRVKRKEKIINTQVVKILIASSLIYGLGLLTWNFLYWRSHGFSFGIQGRYFFPNLPEHMILLLTGWIFLVKSNFVNKITKRIMYNSPATASELYKVEKIKEVKKRIERAVISGLVGGMMVLNWYSLYFLSASYFAVSSWRGFWLQASQYKFWFFKTPILPVIILGGLIVGIWFWWRLVRYNGND